MILGVAIGSSLDFASGSFTGITAASGAGIGIVFGAIIGRLRLNYLKK